jgi:hypothetical protein
LDIPLFLVFLKEREDRAMNIHFLLGFICGTFAGMLGLAVTAELAKLMFQKRAIRRVKEMSEVLEVADELLRQPQVGQKDVGRVLAMYDKTSHRLH